MERCKFSPQRLSFYIDGQSSNKEKTALKKHLKTCECCQEEIILLQIARLALKSFASVKLPLTLDKHFIEKFSSIINPDFACPPLAGEAKSARRAD